MSYSYFDETLPHIIIVGGGFAGLELVKALNNQPYRVTLFDKNNYHAFQPMLYQVAAGGVGPDGIAYPLRKLVSRFPNIAFRMAEVKEVKPEQNLLDTSIGVFTYDYLVIATGAQTNFFGNAQLEQHTLQLKSIPDALDLRSAILQEFEKAITLKNTPEEKKVLNFVVVGGGPTGVETSGALAEMKKNVLPADYKELDASHMQVHLIEAAPRLLAAMSEDSSAAALRFLTDMGVQVQLNTSVTSYNGQQLTLSNGQVLDTETVVWAAGVKAKGLPGLPFTTTGRAGRYVVDEHNKLEAYVNIYALGDVALMQGDPKFPNGHAMIATPAQQQAKHLGKNFLRMSRKQTLLPFRYFDPGTMATVGRHKAVMEIFGTRTQGLIAWLGWMFLHLMLLVGFRNRLVVFVNWMWNYMSYQRAIRIITRPYIKK
ncbi:MAG TPA: NAD(P)/FAD-dependent oxidoreductase [Bacteroidia bacterium]|nr:NAD(P)/FAD-dependent oxidoreductase [Bacteroidia bacterium]